MREIAAHRFFHTVEKSFPQCGKIPKHFSIVWKNGKTFFHCVENFSA